MMSEIENGRVVKKQNLTPLDLAEIQKLLDICNKFEGLNLKINWELLRNRDGRVTSDFFYLRDGSLVGYLALDGWGQELELTGMVHPESRRKGIFRSLLAGALEECQTRKTSRLLLVCERNSVSGQAFTATTGARYSFSEYSMELEQTLPPPLLESRIELHEAGPGELEVLTRIQALSFNEPEEVAREFIIQHLNEKSSRVYIARLQEIPVGKISVLLEDFGVYIRAFGVIPQYRGRGYGRQILAATIQKMFAQNQTHLTLEVATHNQNALGLYQSCGFQEKSIYDYFLLLVK